MWISQRLRVHLPNQGHVTTATYIRARYMTPKHIRNDHAKAFIHVAIIVSSRRSLGGQGYFMLLFFFLKKPCSGSHCNGPVSICCARNSAHVVHMLDIIAFYTCALVDMQLFHLPKTLQSKSISCISTIKGDVMTIFPHQFTNSCVLSGGVVSAV